LGEISRRSASLTVCEPGRFELAGQNHELPRYMFLGPTGGAEPLRIGIFAGLHGDEPVASFTLLRFVRLLEDNPEIARGYCLFLQELETLPLRQHQHSANAFEIAGWLKAHPLVSWVTYPGLPSDPSYKLASKYLKKGFGGLVGFGVKGGLEAGKKFVNSVKLLSHLANIGDAKSLVIHPASTTHSQLAPAELEETGATPDYIRLSVGLEDVEDIKADIDQALRQTAA